MKKPLKFWFLKFQLEISLHILKTLRKLCVYELDLKCLHLKSEITILFLLHNLKIFRKTHKMSPTLFWPFSHKLKKLPKKFSSFAFDTTLNLNSSTSIDSFISFSTHFQSQKSLTITLASENEQKQNVMPHRQKQTIFFDPQKSFMGYFDNFIQLKFIKNPKLIT